MAGIDVGAGGNVFGLTRGLADRFPGRVRDMPISETAIVGTAVSAAMAAGMRPIVEIMYMDFIGVCFEAARDFGVGAELVAMAADEGFWHPDAPIVRVAPPPMPAPYAPSLEVNKVAQ